MSLHPPNVPLTYLFLFPLHGRVCIIICNHFSCYERVEDFVFFFSIQEIFSYLCFRKFTKWNALDDNMDLQLVCEHTSETDVVIWILSWCRSLSFNFFFIVRDVKNIADNFVKDAKIALVVFFYTNCSGSYVQQEGQYVILRIEYWTQEVTVEEATEVFTYPFFVLFLIRLMMNYLFFPKNIILLKTIWLYLMLFVKDNLLFSLFS